MKPPGDGWSIIAPIHKKNTIQSYLTMIKRLLKFFGDRDLPAITTEDIQGFLSQYTAGCSNTTKKARFSFVNAFFNFVRDNLDHTVQNPCNTKALKRQFRPPVNRSWKILEKDVVDEMIFKAESDRDRLMLELMARAGMRIGEVLKLTRADVDGKKLRLRSPKSGRAFEYVYLPQKVARRLNAYINNKGFGPSDRLFPMTYGGARAALLRTANAIGVHVRPHDLRRYAATYASRSGVPIEIVSKVILRHSNLATTQIYLGRVSDEEAFKWIEDINR